MDALAAVIVAAGSGERLPGDTPKQLRVLAGQAMVAWSVRQMEMARADPIVVVVAPGHEEAVHALLSGTTVVTGGDTRQESVRRGLDALPAGASRVLVHDAARPCVSQSLIRRVIDALVDANAVVPSLPTVDTLVEERDGSVNRIVDRSRVTGVQTPQGFDVGLLKRAHDAARRNGVLSSDDGSLVLALGEAVATVAGERTNIKVTYPDDLFIAEAILNRGRR